MTETPHIEDEQRRIAELVRSFEEPAPEPLHRRIESLVAAHQSQFVPRFPRRGARRFYPLGLASTGAVAAAVVAVAIAVDLGGGEASTFSFGQAAASTLRSATLTAPPESQAHHAQLAVAVAVVPFPYWSERFGWRSSGSRTDRVDGRLVTTVFYSDSSGRRIGYAILAGTPAPTIGGGVIAWRGGVPYRLLTENGAAVVTWLRDGHLCVVSGHGVSSATLLRLASWSDHDAAHLDLADRDSVAAFLGAWDGPLHILLNNAGVMATPELRTRDGWELQLATNHLGHFALATGLHDALVAAGSARIVSVSSAGHRFSPVVFQDIHFQERAYDPWLAYGQSKTANILFAVEANKRWASDGITVNALMPGMIQTTLSRYLPQQELERLIARIEKTVGWKTPEQGAATSVLLATSPRLDGIGGRYFEDCNEAPALEPHGSRGVAAHALDPEAAAQLWQVSTETLAM